MGQDDTPFFDDFMDESDKSDGPRYTVAERILRLVSLLSVNTCTQEMIFERLRDFYQVEDASSEKYEQTRRSAVRKLDRDIRFLEMAPGYTVQRDVGPGQEVSYTLEKGYGPQLPFLFHTNELDTLALLHTMFADPAQYTPSGINQPLPLPQPHTPFGENIIALVEHLTRALPDKQQRYFSQLIKKPFVYFNLDSVNDYLPYRDLIDTIIRAITQGRQIRFQYGAMQVGNELKWFQQVDPYYIIYQEGHLYLIGFSHDYSNSYKHRHFEWRIDRIQPDSVQLLPTPVDAAHRRRLIEFRYWVDASLAKGGLSKRWVFQEVEREEIVEKGGTRKRRLLIRAGAYNQWRIIQQLHKYGDKVELIDPPELREAMRQEAKRIYDLYFN